MKKKLIKRISLGLMMIMAVLSMQYAPVMATKFDKVCQDSGISADKKAAAGCSEKRMLPTVLQNIIKAAASVVGVMSVVAIIVAGQRIMTATGDAAMVSKAKQMIQYALVGLAVSILAFAIVSFVSSIVR